MSGVRAAEYRMGKRVELGPAGVEALGEQPGPDEDVSFEEDAMDWVYEAAWFSPHPDENEWDEDDEDGEWEEHGPTPRPAVHVPALPSVRRVREGARR